MCAINGKYKMRFILEVFSSPAETMTEQLFKDLVRNEIVEAEAEMNRTGRIRAHFTEVEDTPVAKRNHKASAIHFPNKAVYGTSLCGTKNKGTRKWLSETRNEITCKRCLHQLNQKTIHTNTMHSVQLVENGPNRIAVVRAIREHGKLGLKEAKELSDVPQYGGGSVKIGSFEFGQASQLIAAIEAAGGKASLV